MIVWDVAAGERRRDARGPRRERSRDWRSPRRRDAVHQRARRQDHHLGSRRRPPPRPPVHGRRATTPSSRATRSAPTAAISRSDRSTGPSTWSTHARSRPASSFPVVPAGPGPGHGLRAARRAARRRRRRRLPRPRRPAQRQDGEAPAGHAAIRSTRPASAPTDGSWRRRATHRVRLYALPSGRPVGRPLAPPRHARIGDVVAQPRRAHAGGHATAGTAASRSSTCPRSGAARRCPTPRRVWDFVRFTPDGRFLAGRELEGLGAAVVDRDMEPVGRRFAGHAGARRVGVDQPRRRHARHRRRRTARSACGTCARSSRSAPRCPACPTGRSSRSSRPTAPTCSPSTATAGAPTAGTCARPRGPATPARWPGGRSPEPSGRTRCPSRDYAPAC